MRAPSEPVKGASADLEEFARNVARIMEEGGNAIAAYLKPREEGRVTTNYSEVADAVKSLGEVAEYWLADPKRAVEMQSSLGTAYLDLWASAVKRMAGEQVDAGGHARPERQALHRSRMVVEPVLRFPQAGLSAHDRMGRPAGRSMPKASTRTRGRRPSSTSGRSPTRSRRRTSC